MATGRLRVCYECVPAGGDPELEAMEAANAPSPADDEEQEEEELTAGENAVKRRLETAARKGRLNFQPKVESKVGAHARLAGPWFCVAAILSAAGHARGPQPPQVARGVSGGGGCNQSQDERRMPQSLRVGAEHSCPGRGTG